MALKKLDKESLIRLILHLPSVFPDLKIPAGTEKELRVLNLKELRGWVEPHQPRIDASREIQHFLHKNEEDRKQKLKLAHDIAKAKRQNYKSELLQRVISTRCGLIVSATIQDSKSTLQLFLFHNFNMDLHRFEGKVIHPCLADVTQYPGHKILQTEITYHFSAGQVICFSTIPRFREEEKPEALLYGTAFDAQWLVLISAHEVENALKVPLPEPSRLVLPIQSSSSAPSPDMIMGRSAFNRIITESTGLYMDIVKIVGAYTIDCDCGQCFTVEVSNLCLTSRVPNDRRVAFAFDEKKHCFSFAGFTTSYNKQSIPPSRVIIDPLGHVLDIRMICDIKSVLGNIETRPERIQPVCFELEKGLNDKCVFREGQFICVSGINDVVVIVWDENKRRILGGHRWKPIKRDDGTQTTLVVIAFHICEKMNCCFLWTTDRGTVLYHPDHGFHVLDDHCINFHGRVYEGDFTPDFAIHGNTLFYFFVTVHGPIRIICVDIDPSIVTKVSPNSKWEYDPMWSWTQPDLDSAIQGDVFHDEKAELKIRQWYSAQGAVSKFVALCATAEVEIWSMLSNRMRESHASRRWAQIQSDLSEETERKTKKRKGDQKEESGKIEQDRVKKNTNQKIKPKITEQKPKPKPKHKLKRVKT